MPEHLGLSTTEVAAIVERRRQEADMRLRREQEVEARVEAISKVRSEIETKIREYQDLSGTLQREIRRVPDAEVQAHYRTFATMQIRMAGAMSQALVRAKAMDRVITASKAELQERRTQEERENFEVQSRDTARHITQLQLPQADDLELLYGEMNDASE